MFKFYFILLFVFLISVMGSNAQSVLHYDFLNTLNERTGVGPALTVLGTEGVFVTDTLSEIEGNNKKVYRFEMNSGVQFNNVAANNFIQESFTIEMYFLFDELSSWKRVVDWKNRKTDWGAYVYYGQLNFYSILYSNEAPVVEDQYTYYVITRNGLTNKVLIYTDAEVKIDFTDNNGDALVDGDGVLNFFFDDLIVPNEASSGAVALIKLYNYVLDSVDIHNNWEDIGGTVFGQMENFSKTKIKVFPNPASDQISIDCSGIQLISDCHLMLVSETGEIINYPIPVNKTTFTIPTESLARGLYLVRFDTGKQVFTSKVLLK
jgi:hypothetical protein